MGQILFPEFSSAQSIFKNLMFHFIYDHECFKKVHDSFRPGPLCFGKWSQRHEEFEQFVTQFPVFLIIIISQLLKHAMERILFPLFSCALEFEYKFNKFCPVFIHVSNAEIPWYLYFKNSYTQTSDLSALGNGLKELGSLVNLSLNFKFI